MFPNPSSSFVPPSSTTVPPRPSTADTLHDMQSMMKLMMIKMQQSDERSVRTEKVNEALMDELAQLKREVRVKSELPLTAVSSSSSSSTARYRSPSSSSDSATPPLPSGSSRSRSRSRKLINSSIKNSKDEENVIENGNNQESREAKVYETISEMNPYESYNAYVCIREKLYPFFDKNNNINNMYDNRFTLLSESGRVFEYVRFMILCDADQRLYPPTSKAWMENRLSSIFDSRSKKNRSTSVSDNIVMIPQLSRDDRDVRYNVSRSGDVDLPVSPFAFFGVPNAIYQHARIPASTPTSMSTLLISLYEEWKEMMNKSFAANVIKNEHAPPSAHTSRTSSTLVSSYASSIPSSSSSSFPTTTLPSSSSAQLSQSSNANRVPIAQKSSGSSSSYNAPQRIVDDYHRMKRNIPVENENRQVHFIHHQVQHLRQRVNMSMRVRSYLIMLN